MKKLFLLAALIVLSVTATFADDLNSNIIEHLKKNYAAAVDIKWEIKENCTVVEFTLGGDRLRSFYDVEGNLIGVSKKVAVESLPAAFRAAIEKKYAGSVVTDALLLSDRVGGAASYYATVVSPSTSVIVAFDHTGHMSKFSTL